MKRLILGAACVATLFIGCEDIEKKASEKLRQAQSAYEQGLYNDAKLLIDSIKTLYPKAYDTRREGLYLLQEVELAEQEKSLAYLDSTLQAKQIALDSLKHSFVFEKDTVYEAIGHYLHPSQVIEKNLHRSFLRFRTDENGVLKLTTIYCGGRNIHHTAVKVIAPDGSFAETPASPDRYETTDLGEKIEKADFKMGADGGVLTFIYNHQEKPLRVQWIGERPYSTALSTADRKALVQLYPLAQLLSSMTEVRKSIEEAQLKKRFVQKKISERKSDESIKK